MLARMPKKERGSAAKFARAREIVRPRIESGEDLGTAELEKTYGISKDTFERAALAEHAARAARLKAEADTRRDLAEEAALARATFSKRGELTIQKAIDLHKKRLERAWGATVENEVIRRIASADNAVRKSYAKVSEEARHLRLLLNKRAFYTPQEFKVILLALHPDNAASTEVRARAFDLLRKNEKRLVTE